MGNKRNTVLYCKEESVAGTAVTPTSSTDGWIPINDDYSISRSQELLESAILSGNIGSKKPQLGLVEATASFSTELRSSGTAGTSPDFDILMESAFGNARTSTADAVQASPAPSTTELWIATAGNIRVGEAMIIQDDTNGHNVRFVEQEKIDITASNQYIDFTDDTGTFAAQIAIDQYTKSGSDTTAGSLAKVIKDTMDAAGGDVFSVEFNATTNKYTISSDGSTTFSLLWNTGANTANGMHTTIGYSSAGDDTGAFTYTSDSEVFGPGLVFNIALANAPTAADVVTAGRHYSPGNTGHKSFTNGTYHGNEDQFEQIIGAKVGSTAIELAVGQLASLGWEITGLSDARTAATASFTPVFQDVQGLVSLCVDLYIDSTAQDFNTLSFTMANEVSDKLSAKECSGKLGNTVTQRTVTFTLNPYMGNNVDRYTELTNLTDFELFVTLGEKTGTNLDDGKTVAIWCPQCMWTQDQASDIDDNLTEDLEGRAHTGSSGVLNEVYMSFL